jgi:hypothetical protein
VWRPGKQPSFKHEDQTTTPKLYEPVFLNIKGGWHTCVATVPYSEEPEPVNVDGMVTVTYLILQENNVPRHDWVQVEDLYPFTTDVKCRTRQIGMEMTLFRDYIDGCIKEPLAALLYLSDKRERDVLKLQYYGEKKGHGVVADRPIKKGEFLTEYAGTQTDVHPKNDGENDDTRYTLRIRYREKYVL